MQEEKEQSGPDAKAADANGEADPAEAQDVSHREPELDAEGKSEGEPAEESQAAEEEGEEVGADAALKEQLLRALADVENVRRRAKKDVEDARAYAISNFAEDLLSVADNLGRALDSIPPEAREGHETVKAIAEGVTMTARELESVLGRHGISKIDPKGEKFDYNEHQALFETAETDQADGTVVEVVQVGYRIGDRLLRAAMVGVAKGGSAGAGDTAEKADAAQAGNDGESVGRRVDTSA